MIIAGSYVVKGQSLSELKYVQREKRKVLVGHARPKATLRNKRHRDDLLLDNLVIIKRGKRVKSGVASGGRGSEEKVIRFKTRLGTGGVVRKFGSGAKTVRNWRPLAHLRQTKPADIQMISPIDGLYTKIGQLNLKVAAHPSDKQLQSELSRSLSELRKLQQIEAEAIEQKFARSLKLAIGEGMKAIKGADALIEKYANLTRQNGPK